MKSEQELLKDLIESLGQAIGAAGQLIHQQQNPKFMMIRQAIELTREGCVKLATFEATKFRVKA